MPIYLEIVKSIKYFIKQIARTKSIEEKSIEEISGDLMV